MKRILSVFGVLVFALAATFAMATPHHGPDDTTIDAAEDKRPAVPFPHGKHATELVESCDTCHHTNPDATIEADEDVQACSACHLEPEEADTPDMAQMSLKKNPFHMVCIDCHKEQDAGPTSCNDCHVKE